MINKPLQYCRGFFGLFGINFYQQKPKSGPTSVEATSQTKQ